MSRRGSDSALFLDVPQSVEPDKEGSMAERPYRLSLLDCTV